MSPDQVSVEWARAECAVIDAARALERCAQNGADAAGAHRTYDDALDRQSQVRRDRHLAGVAS